MPWPKVVMFSDLHWGYINDFALLKQVVQKINKINPDIIFIAGDFLTETLMPSKAQSNYKAY